jgi:hypothetical protein
MHIIFSLGKLNGDITEKTRRRWEDNIRMDPKEIGFEDVDCINLNDLYCSRVYVGVRVPWFVCDTCVSQVLIAVKCAVAGLPPVSDLLQGFMCVCTQGSGSVVSN